MSDDTLDEGAYTLLELLISLFLSTLLLAGATLHAKDILQEHKLPQAAAEVLARLEHYGAMAGIRELEYSISFPDSTHMAVIAPRETSPGEARYWTVPAGVTIARAGFGSLAGPSRTLVLRPDGSTTPGSIELRNSKGRVCTITQALRGARRLSCK